MMYEKELAKIIIALNLNDKKFIRGAKTELDGADWAITFGEFGEYGIECYSTAEGAEITCTVDGNPESFTDADGVTNWIKEH